MWFGDGPEVCGSLGGFVFPARSSAGTEVLQTTDTVSELLQALADGLASPTETTFGLADVAGAELQGDLSQEKTPLVTTQPLGGGLQQGIVAFVEGFHADVPGITGGPGSLNPACHYNHRESLVLGKFLRASRLNKTDSI